MQKQGLFAIVGLVVLLILGSLSLNTLCGVCINVNKTYLIQFLVDRTQMTLDVKIEFICVQVGLLQTERHSPRHFSPSMWVNPLRQVVPMYRCHVRRLNVCRLRLSKSPCNTVRTETSPCHSSTSQTHNGQILCLNYRAQSSFCLGFSVKCFLCFLKFSSIKTTLSN